LSSLCVREVYVGLGFTPVTFCCLPSHSPLGFLPLWSLVAAASSVNLYRPKPKPDVWHGRTNQIGEGSTMTGDLSQNDGMEHEVGHHQHVAGSGTAEGFSREGSREGSDGDGRGPKASSLCLLQALLLFVVLLVFPHVFHGMCVVQVLDSRRQIDTYVVGICKMVRTTNKPYTRRSGYDVNRLCS